MRLPELSEDEKNTLLIVLGMGVGTYANQGNRRAANLVLKLANRLMENEPDWRPYEIVEEDD